MIRKSLYIAASAVALLAGAQAQAATITGATGTIFSTVSSSSATGAYKLAQELTYFTAYSSATAAAATQATATFNLLASNSFTTGESLLLTVDIAAGGIFTSSTGFSATGTGGCNVQSVSAVTPIARNATSAQYLVNLTGTCAAASGIVISAPIQATGADMVVGAKLEQSFGGQLINVDGGRVSATFIDVTRAFTASVSASGDNATALVSSGYRELNSEPTLGTVTVSASTTVNKALAAGSAVSAADIANVALTATAVTGSFTGINVANDGDTFASTSSSATISTVRVLDLGASAAGSYDIDIVDNTATGTTAGINADAVIPASTFTLSAAIDLVDGLTDFNASGPLSSVVRDGTSFKAPWIALGATSANSTIRLANNGTTDTGPITMTLTSTNGGAATTKTVTISAAQVVAGSLSASGGIPAGGTVSISGAALKTAFGTTAANGDVEVTIEAQPQFISGKVRVTQASGQIFETSLGNLTDNRFLP
jgi:hypothetical protein